MKVEGELAACYRCVVVDTNVLLSAALAPRGVPAELVDRLLLEGRLLFSAPTFAELETRIWKPKFDRYLSIERRRDLLREFSASALWVKVPPLTAARRFSRDPNDDIFIHAALAAEASRLISGDDDLLSLHPLADLHIVTPRAALDEILQGAGSPP
ncbi:MAG: putative toxin-antitoxin system toxin component, PIN family [Rhodocyclaceae bacterium]|nr:putative toxin-antitoxin system toxin component, PIN family [Rhodocyclaceae bacterium]